MGKKNLRKALIHAERRSFPPKIFVKNLTMNLEDIIFEFSLNPPINGLLIKSLVIVLLHEVSTKIS